MKKSIRMTRVIVVLGLAVLIGGCRVDDDENGSLSEMSKEEAREMGGKADSGADLCEFFGWYGDEVCDEFCPLPDPDCTACELAGGTCMTSGTGVCLDGDWGDPRLYSCGDDENLVCCLPSEKPETPRNCTAPFPLPDRLKLVESETFRNNVSAIAVADIDGDGCLDIAAIVAKESGTELALVIAWGDPEGEWAERWSRLIAQAPANPPNTPPPFSTRDSSSNVVTIADFNKNGWLDVGTASGVAYGGPNRELSWQELPGDNSDFAKPLPAIFVELTDSGQTELLRGTVAGDVERCTPTSCQALPAAGEPYAVTELAVGDFNHNGYLDVLAGRMHEEGYDPEVGLIVRSWLWPGSSSGFGEASAVEGMGVVDIEVADMNGNGYLDVVSQVREYISDFPSDTDVWISSPTGFTKIQTIGNNDNHNDAMTVADVNGDGCPDRLFIGVDIPEVAITIGNCNGFSDDELFIPTDTTGIGVQFPDVNGDGTSEIVIREAFMTEGNGIGLRFVPFTAN